MMNVTTTMMSAIKTSAMERRACEPPPLLAKSAKRQSGPNYSREKLEDRRRCRSNRTRKDIIHRHVPNRSIKPKSCIRTREDAVHRLAADKQIETKNRKLPVLIKLRKDVISCHVEKKKRACAR